MATQSCYLGPVSSVRAPVISESGFVRKAPVVVGLAGTMLPLLLWLLDLSVSQAVPIAVLVGLAGQRLVELAIGRHQDLFEPANLVAAYFILYFAFRAAYVLGFTAVPRLGFFSYDDYLPEALWCACLGYLAFCAGYYSKIARRILTRLPASRLHWPRAIPGLRICLLLAAGFGAWVYLFSHDAFVVGAVAEEAGRRFHTDPMPGVAVLLSSLLDFGWVAICVSVCLRNRRTNRVTLWVVLSMAAMLLAVRLAYTGGKQYLLEPMAEAMIAYHYLRRRLSFRHAVLVGLPCLFLAFGALNVYRFVIIGESGGAPTSFSDLLSRVTYAWTYFTSDRTDGLQTSALESLMQRQFGVDALALVMKYTPDRRPVGLGESYLQIPLQTFVPRQLWQDKPIYIPTDEFERDYLGVPPGGFTSMHVISDLYQNFYLAGVAAGFFVIGIVFQLLYLACTPWAKNGVRVLVYAVLMPSLVHSLEADPVVNCVVFIRLTLLLVVVMKMLGTGEARKLGKAGA